MRLFLITALALALSGTAEAKAPTALTAQEARKAAYTAAQGYFGDLFDSRVQLGKGQRMNSQAFVFPGRAGREGGYVNCAFRIYVRLTKNEYVVRARSLRCV